MKTAKRKTVRTYPVYTVEVGSKQSNRLVFMKLNLSDWQSYLNAAIVCALKIQAQCKLSTKIGWKLGKVKIGSGERF